MERLTFKASKRYGEGGGEREVLVVTVARA
jgi:hypothetical protein